MPNFSDIQDILEDVHPLPRDLMKVYVLGDTSVGKTSLIREIMGTTEAGFPMVEEQRTTTVPTEYILRSGDLFKLTVLFKTEEEIKTAIEDVVMNAIEAKIDNKSVKDIKEELEETWDQTVRFKFILDGDYLATIAQKILDFNIDKNLGAENILSLDTTRVFMRELIDKMYDEIDKKTFERTQKNISDKTYRKEFDDKTTFIEHCKSLLSNNEGAITPILSYARIEGELLHEDKELNNKQIIFIDSQGVNHDLNEKNTRHFDYFEFADSILFIEKASEPFKSTIEIIKNLFEKGYGDKLKIVFNKFNKNEDIETQKTEIKLAIKNLKNNRSSNVSINEENTHYLTTLDDTNELSKILADLSKSDKRKEQVQMTCNFNAKFTLEYVLSNFSKKINTMHWKTGYAFNRRMCNKEDYYQNNNGTYSLIWDICNALFTQIDFQETVGFNKEITPSSKKLHINRIKQYFFQHILTYTRYLVLEKQQEAWNEALKIRGQGAQKERANKIKKILASISADINSPEFSQRVNNSLQAICSLKEGKIKLSRTANKGRKIEIHNHKIIKYAEVKLDSLTIIAGENNTGKSTISKAFYMEVKRLLTKRNSLSNPDLGLYTNSPVFIDTPDILDKFAYIHRTSLLLLQNNYKSDLADWVMDLILRFSEPVATEANLALADLYQNIQDIIQGEITYMSGSEHKILYKRKSLSDAISMTDTSTGIKMFGCLQLLIRNHTLRKNSILILDEPEVHIHPKWQLKYAQIIIGLVKHGIRVLLSSHSPYMIEALVRYAGKDNIPNMQLYLTEMQDEYAITQNVTNDIGKIFRKLSEPFDEFEQMDVEDVING